MTITHWKFASAQTVGRGHIKQQLPCQDYTFCVQTQDMTILVLADGAGSAPSSHIGAQTVVHKMMTILQNHFEEMFEEDDQQLLRKRIIGILLNELEGIENFSGNIKEYASTLLYVAIKGDRYLAGHIGDGVIGLQVAGGSFKVLSNPENGLFANTTYFITSDEAWKYLRLYKGETHAKTGFILMSDGTADSLFNKKKQGFAPAIPRMLDWLRNHPNQKIAEVLETNLDSVIKQQTQDDCSIALAALTTWNPEELLEASPEYLADFIGIHSMLAAEGMEADQESSTTTELAEPLQQVEDEYMDVESESDEEVEENESTEDNRVYEEIVAVEDSDVPVEETESISEDEDTSNLVAEDPEKEDQESEEDLESIEVDRI
ncbi:protein phosphatase 2C domain-containing protein [Bacillus timonensis]|uniref:Protein phosphatase 2C domain-containing protein n=1 Tax=Bacillus timonensis TaxID=1033734 RepID=A0A4S3PRK2_9BACI|nr:PP2C family serine/threonine-protein phosphatase [Bacillus timonensis]THE12317.1 protein phosphatase 2C domain-containing protein [Bacillus timonensis]